MEPFGSIPSGSLDQDRKFLLLEQRLNDKKLKEKFTETNKTPGGRSSSGSSKENSYGKEINVPPAINSVQNAVALENVHSMSNHQVINNNSSTAAQVAETVELTKECSSGNENSKLIHKRKNENFSPGNKNSKLITIEDSNQDAGSKGGVGSGASGAATANMLSLHHYFGGPSSTTDHLETNKPPNKLAYVPTKLTSTTSRSSGQNSNTSTAHGQTQNQQNQQNQNLNLNLSPDWKRQLESMKTAKDVAEGKLSRAENELRNKTEHNQILESRTSRLSRSLEDVHRKMAVQDARQRRDRLALNCVRLGKFTPKRVSPTVYHEVWEEGYALSELTARGELLARRKEELEARKRRLTTQKRGAKKGGSSAGGPAGYAGGDTDDFDLDVDLFAEAEAIKAHIEQLKKDETALVDERRLLETEKAAHQKELKRCHSEDQSRFTRDLPVLPPPNPAHPELRPRYLLTALLGKGGFSEVWRALDLDDLREVAVKVHQLNPMWTEKHRTTYIRHVTREYRIHRDLQHPRVVRLFDVFEIDDSSFATVLEYCKGTDLDEKLKREKFVVEKEARVVLLQMVCALRYLNNPSSVGPDGSLPGEGDSHEDNGAGGGSAKKRSIIHFDLKPANILFDEYGDVKITDFGLSKILDESDENTSLELTSQGAGTYWYLPPECFAAATGGEAPRISGKVDIWSLGVIYYQMLFGKKPFGEGKSQDMVLAEGTILNANQVNFPTAPKVSEEARDFIRMCLTHDQKYRPDVYQLCQHPYIRKGDKVKFN